MEITLIPVVIAPVLTNEEITEEQFSVYKFLSIFLTLVSIISAKNKLQRSSLCKNAIFIASAEIRQPYLHALLSFTFLLTGNT
jgi:hypothetical protein